MFLRLMKPWLRWTAKAFPQTVGALDYHLRSDRDDLWGGAFNGQCFRQVIVADLLRECQPAAIVETGTFHGASTLFLAMNGKAPVYSSEVNPRNFGYASRRLRNLSNLTLFRRDSREFLKGLPLSADRPIFFYLDAHWEEDLPLREEADFIINSFSRFVIMIDDFQVPDDPGYGFDDYGAGKRLALRDFPFHRDERISVYFPKRPSHTDTGGKRGCVILASHSLASTVDHLESLRCYNPMHSNVANIR